MMRLQDRSFPVTDAFYEAFKKEMNFECKGKPVNISTFLNRVIVKRFEVVGELFHVERVSKLVEFQRGTVVDEKVTSSHSLVLPLKSALFSLSAYIKNHFFSPFETIPLKSFEDKNGKKVILRVNRGVRNNSAVVTFEINRLAVDSYTRNYIFNNDAIFVEHEIILNNTLYALIANIEYDQATGTYSTVVLDFGDLCRYRYNSDGSVTPMQRTTVGPDCKSVLLFYVPKESMQTCDRALNNIPQSLAELASSILNENKQLTNQTPMVTSNILLSTDLYVDALIKWNLIYKPTYNAHDPIFISAQQEINSKISIWPVEILNVFSKLVYGTFELGSEDFSFKKAANGVNCTALEILLTSFAANPKIVAKLVEIASFPEDLVIESKIAIFVVKMLLGCKEISLDSLIEEFSRANRNIFSRNFDVAALYVQMKLLVQVIDNTIISSPLMRSINYLRLDSDDPIKSTSQTSLIHPVTLPNLIPPRPATIKGVWFDSFDTDTSRLRSIYSSTSEMFFLNIERRGAKHKSFYFNSESYICTGAIAIDKASNTTKVYFIDNTQSMYRIYTQGKETEKVQMTGGSNSSYEELIKRQAVQLFFTKKSAVPMTKLYTNIIPRTLAYNIVQDLANEMKINL